MPVFIDGQPVAFGSLRWTSTCHLFDLHKLFKKAERPHQAALEGRLDIEDQPRELSLKKFLEKTRIPKWLWVKTPYPRWPLKAF